ncbi:MAG: polysaccharide deacetylase family protein [Vicinamibacteria bacterium]|nr:polysaccharide deacetylase family protein [Vicinamibacteria bacterium]
MTESPGDHSTSFTVLVGVDTEADDQWSEQGRRSLGVGNAARLPALQRLCDSLGVRPTYFVTHEMATRGESAAVLRELRQNGRCEIGAHLHPWSSPPFLENGARAHEYPNTLPTDLFDRQLTELTQIIEQNLGARPSSYRAGRLGCDGRSLPIIERLGYTVDSSVDPLFNERRKGGPSFAGAPHAPYRPDYHDIRRRGRARLLEIPISSGTRPPLPRPIESLYARIPSIPYRGALRRLGLRGVWLRPSYSSFPDMAALASRIRRHGLPCANLLFHSSELLPGGSPYTPDAESVQRFLGDLERLLDHLTRKLGAVGRTYAEFERAWADGAESRK